MDVVEIMTLEELRSTVTGSAYVDAVAVDGDHTKLNVVAPGIRLEVAVPGLPDMAAYERPKALQTVLAVQIRLGTDPLECSVLGTAPGSGPTRVPITIGQALKAAAAGIHTVLVSS